jgi:hypothetical protein
MDETMDGMFAAEVAAPTELDLHFELLGRFGLSAALGLIIAGLYRWSRPPGQGLKGLASTVMLLAPLITMVTLAVGSNIAAAFTLVGTLAIVRFRTSIRDPQDTAYVIFAVAAGLASGNMTYWVALYGTLVVSALIAGTKLFTDAQQSAPPEVEKPRAATARTMVLVLCPPDPDAVAWSDTIKAHGGVSEVLSTKVDGEAQTLTIQVAVRGIEPEELAQVSVELLSAPEVRSASFRAL